MCASCLGSTQDIQCKIEDIRTYMNRLADELGHVHPAVMRVSEQLDELLLQYYQMVRKLAKSVHSCSL